MSLLESIWLCNLTINDGDGSSHASMILADVVQCVGGIQGDFEDNRATSNTVAGNPRSECISAASTLHSLDPERMSSSVDSEHIAQTTRKSDVSIGNTVNKIGGGPGIGDNKRLSGGLSGCGG